MWQIKQLVELSSQELYDIMKLRVDTFVVEQERIYPELDEIDLEAFHIFWRDELSGHITAYARVFKTGEHVTFGRVVTDQSVRGTGLGAQLLTQILACCQRQWPNQEIVIEAQQQVTGFYAKRGFKETSDVFLFNHTPHVEMRFQNKVKVS